MRKMKLMSFNTLFCTNYFTKEKDFAGMAEVIKKCKPNIVGLNEMYGKSEMPEYDSQTEKLSELTQLKYHKFAEACILEEGTFGNAVLSDIPFISAEVIPVPEEEEKKGTKLYEPRCLLKLKYENGLTLLIIHFGLNEDEHKNAVKTVLENLTEEKCVLMGDFNVTPDNPVLNPIKEKLIDTAQYFNEPKLTFPSPNPYKKIDYIFVSKDIKILSADVPDLAVSDHLPHTVEIDI